MKASLIYLFIFLSPVLKSQDISGSVLLEKSIAYHDPQNKWKTFNADLIIDAYNDKNEKRSSRTISLNMKKGSFKMVQSNNDGILTHEVKSNSCESSYKQLNENKEKKKPDVSCARAKMFRNYFTYLYGLPMKLKDAGTNINPLVKKSEFQGKPCYELKVNYDESVGKDIWYFYFDKKTYAMIGYRFYKNEAANDGEYITLEKEIEIGGVKIPQNRHWYYNKNDQLLGADFLKKKN